MDKLIMYKHWSYETHEYFWSRSQQEVNATLEGAFEVTCPDGYKFVEKESTEVFVEDSSGSLNRIIGDVNGPFTTDQSMLYKKVRLIAKEVEL